MPDAPPRRRMSSQDRRSQILAVTKAIMDEDGLHGLSIEQVARRAGVTRTLVYQHFTDLTGLLTAFVDRALEAASDAVLQVLPENPREADPGVVAAATFPALLRAATQDPGAWRLLLSPPEGAPPELREHITRVRAASLETTRVLTQRLIAGLPGSAFPDPEITAHMLQTIGDELIRLHLRDPEQYPAERLQRYAASVSTSRSALLRLCGSEG